MGHFMHHLYRYAAQRSLLPLALLGRTLAKPRSASRKLRLGVAALAKGAPLPAGRALIRGLRGTLNAALLKVGLVVPALLTPALLSAAEYRLIVHPILPAERTEQIYRHLTDYLSKATGETIRLEVAHNYVSYWQDVRRGGYHLIMDGPHLTDYRIQRMGYIPLAKITDVVSYSLVASPDELVLDAIELTGKRVATIPSPSLGAVRLAHLFPNPMRQPIVVAAEDSLAALEMVKNGKASAAMVPTPLAGLYPSLTTVLTTEQTPHVAISASPDLPAPVRNAVRQALINAGNTSEGKRMLEAINVPGFEAADASMYKGLQTLLQGVWGY